MLRTLAGLVAELRAVGIPVSPTEHIDAATALRHTEIADRVALRAALATTLVKNPDHLRAFGTVFDLYFAGRRGDLDPGRTSDVDSPQETDATGGPAGGGSGLGGLSDEELADVAYRSVRDGDRVLMRALAGPLVDRYAAMEPGRRVAGVYYLSRTMRSLGLDAILDRLRGEAEADAADPLDRRLRIQSYAARGEALREAVEWEIRERLVADRGPQDVARTLRRPLPEDVDFLTATGRDAAAIREALRPLARKLAARLARRRRANRAARLDFRATVRRSLSTGGTPVDLVFRKPHPTRPELMVVADVSGSVATFASFTLQLVYALRSEFARVRTFVFIDGIEEVTELMEKTDTVADMIRRINDGAGRARVFGGSDYGSALLRFERTWGAEVRRTTTVIVLGDARNNYLAPRVESLDAVARRARDLYWLNPEPRAAWNDGDSIIGRYAPYCDGVFECRTIRQLRQFVEQLE